MGKEYYDLVAELLLNSKMSKYELVLLAFNYAKILKEKKTKELEKENYYLSEEALYNVLSKKISWADVSKKLKDKKSDAEKVSEKKEASDK